VGSEIPAANIVVLIGVAITAVTDVWKFKVYNLLTLPLLCTGLLYHGFVGGTTEFTVSLLGALFGFTVLLPFYFMGGMGAGDVKLMAAVGAWLGIPQTFSVFIASSMAAGCYALYLIFAHGMMAETWVNLKILCHRLRVAGRYLGAEDNVEATISRADRACRLIPFAAMVAVGVLARLVWVRIKGEL
jgi:prepilin peptidase CpaA